LPTQYRSNVQRRACFDQRIARIAGEKLRPLAFKNFGNNCSAVHLRLLFSLALFARRELSTPDQRRQPCGNRLSPFKTFLPCHFWAFSRDVDRASHDKQDFSTSDRLRNLRQPNSVSSRGLHASEGQDRHRGGRWSIAG
jgi:hypothetical protein